MLLASVNPNSKVSFGFVYPPTGKIKLYVQSSLPVDVFIANNQQVSLIQSSQTAANLGLFGYLRHNFVNNEIVIIPPGWRDGFQLVIGNNNPTSVSVSYMVWNA
jgi:hypothetical protein